MEKPNNKKIKDEVFFNAYTEVYNQINHIVKHNKLDMTNFDELVKAAMEAVEHSVDLTKTSGTQKAELVKQLISKVLNDLNTKDKLDEQIPDWLPASFDLLAPVIFKLVVSADKGQFNLHNVSDIVETTTSSCFGRKKSKTVKSKIQNQ